MGKAGEKQKRRPKIKDKKQSERFKETARQLGADEVSGDFDSVVRALAKVVPPLLPEPQMPINSQLVGINPGGIVMLANNTYWRIAPGDLALAKKWIPGTEITVTFTDVKKPWLFKLTNTDSGEYVAANQSRPPPK